MSETAADIEALYRDEFPALLRFFRAGRMGRESAEDLAQDTFKEAVRNAERVAGAESPRAYLFGIARNLRCRFFRQLVKTVPFDEDKAKPVELAEPDPRLEALNLALLDLDDLHREVLELRLHHELRYAEIAEVLGIPVGTVRSRIHHSIAKLRKQLTTNDQHE